MVITTHMAAPEATNSGNKRVSNINIDENYSLDVRNTEILKVSEVLEKEGIQHQVGECVTGNFIKIDEKLSLLNEFFYNAAIKQKEWKIRFLIDGKYGSHYKASNVDKILAKVKQLLA